MIFFIRYFLIGVLNTLIHWLVFFAFYCFMSSQAFCNFMGFSVACFFSYVLNSIFNFKAKMRFKKFIIFYFMLGTISLLVGFFADRVELTPLLTLVITSAISFFFGFFLSKKMVFGE
ncbi:GtrA family protein [Acinetobacter marinus]|uniref:GtrA family protein n=1 Tax=Acinetobacter marinus TaxID=281375 RepID=UPI000B8674C1